MATMYTDSYDSHVVFSSHPKVEYSKQSYEDDYYWFEEVCEDYNVEPECYED